MNKIRVGIIYGGKSAEHEVSLKSAKSILQALDKSKYEPVLIGIDKEGGWHLGNETVYLIEKGREKMIFANDNLALIPSGKNTQLLEITKSIDIEKIDVAFPVLHGTFGEDGTMQGLLKLADIPFVGPDVLGSAIGMDKEVTKRLLKEASVPVAKFISLKNEQTEISFEEAKSNLGYPIFIKPATLGSSVGISKAENEEEFKAGIEEAFKYSNKILLEESISGREIECSVMGNENPLASLPGEIIPHHEFYTYEAKYLDKNGAELKIPADLNTKTTEKIQKLAIKTFETLECEGMARVDMFLRGEEIFINEINTIPGFTKISMYPKLWEASGMGYSKLLDMLIGFAIERFNREKKLLTSYS